MSARELSKVSPALWRSGRFNSLSNRGKVGFLYFVTNAHVPSCGVYFLHEGYACADLGWALEEYQSVRAELVAAELIDYDAEHSVVLIERWFKHNPPANDSHAKGCLARLNEVESTRLREKALKAFETANEVRIQRAAEKRANTPVAKGQVTELVGDASRLMGTRLMGGRR